MDEASSRIRLQIDSKPEQLDKIQRKLLQSKIEYESLKKDDDKKSLDRSEDLKNKYQNLKVNIKKKIINGLTKKIKSLIFKS